MTCNGAKVGRQGRETERELGAEEGTTPKPGEWLTSNLKRAQRNRGTAKCTRARRSGKARVPARADQARSRRTYAYAARHHQ